MHTEINLVKLRENVWVLNFVMKGKRNVTKNSE